MQDGVLVVDERGVIRQFNARAERMLGPLPAAGARSLLAEYAPALAAQLRAVARRTRRWMSTPARLTSTAAMSARFVPVGRQPQRSAP